MFPLSTAPPPTDVVQPRDVPRLQRQAIIHQSAVAHRTLSTILHRCRAYGCSGEITGAIVHITPVGMWQFPTSAGCVVFSDPPDMVAMLLPAAGQHARGSSHVMTHGLDAHSWATILVHEAAHVMECLRLGSKPRAIEAVRVHPYEELRPSFLAACDTISRQVFGCPLTPALSGPWPEGQRGADPFIKRLAHDVAAHLAPTSHQEVN